MRLIIIAILLSSCSSSFLKYNKGDSFFKNEEFERQVKIETHEPVSVSQTTTVNDVSAQSENKTVSSPTTITKIIADALPETKAKKGKKKKTIFSTTDSVSVSATVTVRQPDLEDNEGFISGSRRPLKDPFKVGEKVIHEVSYFGAEAGRLTLEVKPYATVNNKQSYHFAVAVKSTSIFSAFYSVDDSVDTFLDYDTILPYVLKINIKESKKLIKSEALFNHETNKASFWEKKYTEKDGEEEKKYMWDIMPFSQNAYSGFFYMRLFTWSVGKEISFRVAEDQKNVVFKGTAVAREKISTDAGTFYAFKIKADIITRGALSKKGNIYLWISDDEHKYVLRIEADIKIGTVVSEAVEIRPGR